MTTLVSTELTQPINQESVQCVTQTRKQKHAKLYFFYERKTSA